MNTFLPFPSLCSLAVACVFVSTAAQASDTANDSLTETDILATVRLNQPTVRQRCWEPRKATIGSTSVRAAIRIKPDGAVERVEASGDSDAMVDCVSQQVRTWRFPQSNKPSLISVPFKFVVQR